MLVDGHVEVRASTVWQGEKVTAAMLLPAEAWANSKIREDVKQDMRRALGEAIAERLDVSYLIAQTQNDGGVQA